MRVGRGGQAHVVRPGYGKRLDFGVTHSPAHVVPYASHERLPVARAEWSIEVLDLFEGKRHHD